MNTSAQPPLYLANEGPYAEQAREQQTADASADAGDVITPANAKGGWGAYSGARGQTTPPAPVSNVYRSARAY